MFASLESSAGLPVIAESDGHTSTALNSGPSVPPVKLDRGAARRSLTGVTQLGGGP